MKKTTVTTSELDLGKLSFMKHVRSDLGDQILRHWAGCENSVIGLQYLRLKDGKVSMKEFPFERTDILGIWLPDVCNIFVECDGQVDVQVFDGVELTSEEEDRLVAAAERIFRLEAKYVAKEKKFLDERPWLQVDGMAPMMRSQS